MLAPARGWRRCWWSLVRLLTPDAFYRSLEEIDPVALRNGGFRALILDVDNTLVAWHEAVVPERLLEWLGRVREAGLAVCLVSNNTTARVRDLAGRLGVPGIPRAVKPRRGALRRALSLLDLSPHEAVAVGDQVFTDVLAAKRVGMRAYLVQPLHQREFAWTRLVRRLEKAWLRYLARRGLLSAPGEPAP